MKPLRLSHVQGCLVKRVTPGGQDTLGVVKMAIADSGEIQVHWFGSDRPNFVDATTVSSGFQNGQDVLDCTPGTGVRSLGQGVIMQQRNLAGSEQALVDFPERRERHWIPYQYLRYIKGVRHRFVQAQQGQEPDAERLRLRMLAHAIKVWNENTGSLSHLEIDPLPHQINLVHHILASNNLSWLIADDVGLGKTIETGMLLHALIQRNRVKRILLITPAGLTKQWQDELYYKFKLEDFEIYHEDFVVNEPRQWKMHDCVIGSLDRLKQPDHLESLLQAEPWDLVIFDEGHRLSRRQYGLKFDSSERYDLAKALRSRTQHMLLLSATPHQGMQDKFVALLELLCPERRQELLMLSLKPEILRDMVYRNHKADVTDADGHFIFQGKLTSALKVPSSPESIEFDQTLQAYLRKGYAAGEAMGRTGNAIGFVMTVYRKLAVSSAAAIHQALQNRLQRLLDDHAEDTVFSEPTDQRYVGEWEEQVRGEAEEFFAGEIHLLKELIDDAASLMANDLKLTVFIDKVISSINEDNPNEKVLIFTEYRTTQSYLRDALAARFGDGKVALINGSMQHAERREAITQFEAQGRFLISTEAGGEGINLQRHCHIMVNYDLPWNPMRLVQRIGRLYRYGQKLKVVVFNIQQSDSLDQDIVDLMYERIDSVVRDLAQVQEHEFNEGLKDEILGEVADLVDVEDILQQATKLGIERTRERIDAALEEARRAAEKQREIFAHAATNDANELGDQVAITIDHLQSFVTGMFEQLGVEISIPANEPRLLRIRLPELVMQELGLGKKASSRMDVTVDRALAARRPDTRMLDLTSSLMQYLLAKACLYDFGGLVGSVCAPCLGEGSSALFGVMLRWQGPQGNRVRQEFVTILAGQEGTKVNSEVVGGWLMQPAHFSAQMASVDTSRALYDAVNKVAIKRLSELSNQYLIPESLDWAGAAWTFSD